MCRVPLVACPPVLRPVTLHHAIRGPGLFLHWQAPYMVGAERRSATALVDKPPVAPGGLDWVAWISFYFTSDSSMGMRLTMCNNEQVTSFS